MIFDLGSTAVLVGQFAFIYVLILCAFEQRDSYNQVARNETKVCFFFLFVVWFYCLRKVTTCLVVVSGSFPRSDLSEAGWAVA